VEEQRSHIVYARQESAYTRQESTLFAVDNLVGGR
jgi:hypothetical protein